MATQGGSLSPLSVALISGAIGLLGTAVGAISQGVVNLKLERQKFESGLILKAIETGNPDSAAKNLLFLTKLGFITDTTGKIAQLETRPQDSPVLPPMSQAATQLLSQLGLSVQGIQQSLKEAGYYAGAITGLYDQQTSDAVKKFQQARGMPADGFIGHQTAAELEKMMQQKKAN